MSVVMNMMVVVVSMVIVVFRWLEICFDWMWGWLMLLVELQFAIEFLVLSS